MDTLVNRVANSPIVTLNLAEYLPTGECISFDISEYIFKGLLLKEKDFRTTMKDSDWIHLEDKVVCVVCSTDAIIPQWAYALIASTFDQIAKEVFIGTEQEYLLATVHANIHNIDVGQYQDRPIILKGCGDKRLPPQAYALMTTKLKGVAKSVMYGEACSAVPIYKRPR